MAYVGRSSSSDLKEGVQQAYSAFPWSFPGTFLVRRRIARRKGSLVDFFRKSPLVQEQVHLTLLDEATKGREDVEQGRTLSVAQLCAKHRLPKKR